MSDEIRALLETFSPQADDEIDMHIQRLWCQTDSLVGEFRDAGQPDAFIGCALAAALGDVVHRICAETGAPVEYVIDELHDIIAREADWQNARPRDDFETTGGIQ